MSEAWLCDFSGDQAWMGHTILHNWHVRGVRGSDSGLAQDLALTSQAFLRLPAHQQRGKEGVLARHRWGLLAVCGEGRSKSLSATHPIGRGW